MQGIGVMNTWRRDDSRRLIERLEVLSLVARPAYPFNCLPIDFDEVAKLCEIAELETLRRTERDALLSLQVPVVLPQDQVVSLPPNAWVHAGGEVPTPTWSLRPISHHPGAVSVVLSGPTDVVRHSSLDLEGYGISFWSRTHH